MTYVETESQSWFGRIGNSIKGILFGFVLIIASFVLLFWNEGRAVKRYQALEEGAGAVVSVPATEVAPANEGQLVHVSAEATTNEILSDPTFGVSAQAISLEREVEMYQWKERKDTKSKKKLGGGKEKTTTYRYSKVWSSKLISSTSFRQSSDHLNPNSMPITSKNRYAKNVTLGAFRLPSFLISEIGNSELLQVTDENLPDRLRSIAQLTDSGVFIGNSPMEPGIGDLRIKFKIVRPQQVSVIAQQVGKSFAEYQTKSGSSLSLLESGTHSADVMLTKAQESNAMITWAVRGGGALLMVIGISLIFAPIAVFADVVPVLGTIVGAGAGVISLLLGFTLSIMTIAVAWIFYRPLIGCILIAVSLGLIWLLMHRAKASLRGQAA